MNYLKLKRLMIVLGSVFLMSLVFVIKNVCATDYYMPDHCADLQECFSLMSGGDTLVIRDGTYTGIENMISHTQHPPNGSAQAYTIIKAENIGKVVFDGENTRQMFALYGGGQGGNFHHMQFEGLGFSNTDSSLVSFVFTDHIKIFRCFCYDAGGSGQGYDGFAISHSSYVLLEDCWSYGAGRKHFYIGKSAEKVLIRRCLVRHDRHFDYMDQEAFMLYDCKETELQNCISIDGDQGNYYTGGNPAAKSFTVRNTGDGFELEDTYVKGCMSIGNKDMMGALGSAYNPTTFTNFIHWDSEWGSRLRGEDSNFNHCTLGNVTGTGTLSPLMYLEMHDPIINSLLYSAYRGIWNAVGNDYNSLYNVDIEFSGCSAGGHSYCNANSNAIDPVDGTPGNGTPALKYLIRIEDGSNLDGTASDGGDRGATIIKRMGKSGTFWGEPGYNLLQDGTNGQADENLWPFPNEDIIKEHMQSYAYDDGSGGDPEITGNRGFASSENDLFGKSQTLTRYIWQYLGNEIPCEIYDECGINDTTPPTRSNGVPTGQQAPGTTQIIISLTTDENAVCKYSTTPGTDYSLMQNTFSTTNSTTHSTLITGLEDGNSYTCYIRSEDIAGNTNSDDFLISFEVGDSSGDEANDDGDDSSGGNCFITTISSCKADFFESAGKIFKCLLQGEDK